MIGAGTRLLKDVARRALPNGQQVRRLPVGVGRGLKMKLDLRGGHCRFYLGIYECELNGYLKQFCRPGARSFDLGAQMGYDSLLLAKLTSASVLAVDCDEAACSQVRLNASLNPGLASLITCHQAIVGDVVNLRTGLTTIDELAQRSFTPDLIKLDIEGGEAAALRGAKDTLRERHPDLIVEVHSRELESECLELLRENGYLLKVVDPRAWMPDLRPIEHNRWLIATCKSVD